ncbi:GNAT family N-acetyltransferase [Agromyces soli]|uniref:GNAT family N-acetyltransferase n=1 Tax=Agromyces soli TaxID=659012 RepID=A0ABY4AUJ3_9MICO|nr:GNAT family N-acetyltransferase [Agromyces soli]UOE25506.1 GNAT family N-acetyltransferase [Agromyces soli]
MRTVTVRAMTPEEYEAWQSAIAEEYATEQVASGAWLADGAVERARAENAGLLPDGLETERMLLLLGIDPVGEPVGRAWVSLDHPRGTQGVAFLYAFEILEERRGAGFGRALLTAVEQATREAGADALELNVFGSNTVALGLYASSGYAVVTQQMRKPLGERERSDDQPAVDGLRPIR